VVQLVANNSLFFTNVHVLLALKSSSFLKVFERYYATSPCLFTFALFGLSQKMKWFSAQQKLSPRGLSYLYRVKPNFGLNQDS